MHHVTYLRMRRAAELLATTEDKIETIAGAVGYQNPFVFSTTFKARMQLEEGKVLHFFCWISVITVVLLVLQVLPVVTPWLATQQTYTLACVRITQCVVTGVMLRHYTRED